jgi:hypothetical protein
MRPASSHPTDLQPITLIALLFLVACSPAPHPTPVSPLTTEPSSTATPLAQGPSHLPQGSTWTQLADRRGPAEGGTIQVFTSADEFRREWTRTNPGAVVGETSIARPLFVILNPLVSAGCPEITLKGIVFDPAQRLIYAEFFRPNPGNVTCGDVGGSHTFVVAIDRDALPSGPMKVRLEREFEVCADCGREREQVDVNL